MAVGGGFVAVGGGGVGVGVGSAVDVGGAGLMTAGLGESSMRFLTGIVLVGISGIAVGTTVGSMEPSRAQPEVYKTQRATMAARLLRKVRLCIAGSTSSSS